jgi:hypothetical protein
LQHRAENRADRGLAGFAFFLSPHSHFSFFPLHPMTYRCASHRRPCLAAIPFLRRLVSFLLYAKQLKVQISWRRIICLSLNISQIRHRASTSRANDGRSPSIADAA